MAEDTKIAPGVKDAPEKMPEEQASGQVGPTPEKPDPAKAVPFEQAKTAAKEAPAKPDKATKAPAQHDKAPQQPKQAPPAKGKPAAQHGKAPAQKKTPAAKKSPATKEAPAEKTAAEKKADRAAVEKELREKFGIPKSEKPVAAWVPPETETVEKLAHAQLRPFNNHPFNVDTKDPKFMALTVSIRTHGITQPIIARPVPGAKGKSAALEIVSGHRRQAAALAAGLENVPVIVRALNNDQAIQQMVEDNVNNRDIGTMELAKALKMQLDSLKHQGAQDALGSKDLVSADDVGKRSNQIVAERNGMSVKQVQRHISLTNLVPALQEMVDGKAVGDKKSLKISFTPAVELSAIKDKGLQDYIAVAVEGQQSAPSLEQAQRMKKLAEQGILNPDVIDGILLEEKKEVANVILSSQELSQYFGKEATPREMKEKIIKLLDDNMGQHKDMAKPEKKAEQEK